MEVLPVSSEWTSSSTSDEVVLPPLHRGEIGIDLTDLIEEGVEGGLGFCSVVGEGSDSSLEDGDSGVGLVDGVYEGLEGGVEGK